MSEQLRVSGVITAFDRPSFLRQAVVSALEQTMPLHELIVIDDGSPTDLASVVEPFGNRVRYLRLAGNQGANAARNAGVAEASGDAVAFLDDDDRWLPEKIERQVAMLAAGYDAVLCGWTASDSSETCVHPLAEVNEAMLRVGNPYCGTSGFVARREALLREPFDLSLAKGQEWDVYVRLAQGQVLGYVAEPLYLRDIGDHSRITLNARNLAPHELFERARAVHKHRAWLGETCYRNQLAAKLLEHIKQRESKHRYLFYALRHAGVRATTMHLWRKVMKKRQG